MKKQGDPLRQTPEDIKRLYGVPVYGGLSHQEGESEVNPTKEALDRNEWCRAMMMWSSHLGKVVDALSQFEEVTRRVMRATEGFTRIP